MADQLVLGWGLLVAGVCAFMGYRAHREWIDWD